MAGAVLATSASDINAGAAAPGSLLAGSMSGSDSAASTAERTAALLRASVATGLSAAGGGTCRRAKRN